MTMRCALASKGFINEDLHHNQTVMIETLKQCSGKADIVIFGEAFLQGFYAATFQNEHDRQLAVACDHFIITAIQEAAKTYAIAVSFGFIEKVDDTFYSSQLTIDAEGQILDLFRRVSPGWKIPTAGPQYCEGNGFHAFFFQGKKAAVGLCGDLWFDENVEAVNKLNPDVVFWPVYTDYEAAKWNESEKHEYANQAAKVCDTVLYVNSYCLDKTGAEYAKGGSALFVKGQIAQEIPSGAEGILIVEI